MNRSPSLPASRMRRGILLLVACLLTASAGLVAWTLPTPSPVEPAGPPAPTIWDRTPTPGQIPEILSGTTTLGTDASNLLPQSPAASILAFRVRLLQRLADLGPDGHATAEIEALLIEMLNSALPASKLQQLLWETALASESAAARRLLYDMLERVGSADIAGRIVEHFDAMADPSEKGRLLQLLARGLEVSDSQALEATQRMLLERNTERVAELFSRLLATPGTATAVQRTALDLLPEVMPAEQALQWLSEARRQGVLSSASFYDAAVRVVFSEPAQIALRAPGLLQTLSLEPGAVRHSVDEKLFAFIAANSNELGPARDAIDLYVRQQESALLARSGSLSAPEWVTAHHQWLKARSSVGGPSVDLARGAGLDMTARATLVNANPAALETLNTAQLTQLAKDLRAAVTSMPADNARTQSMLDAAALLDEVASARISGAAVK